MTREEAIFTIEHRDGIMDYGETEQLAEALEMAIAALKAEPCEDAVKMASEALKQEAVLDEIRAEIEQEYNCLSATRADETLELGECLGLKMSLKIINKYRTKSGDKE